MTLYTDRHTGKVYSLGKGHYSRTVTQYPQGTKVWYDGSSTAKPTATVTFETQAQRTAWVKMMQFTV
jgi:hypothetical protein